ncbi:hypothetical protein GVN21_19730, partial [Caulobacter sp. SLTY]|uniref:hypothetical protein n=1 Tax=Caulobacter sp. SLTY TaxID=2683262 RepID=UPI0014136A7A
MFATARLRTVTAGALCVLIAAGTPTTAVMAGPPSDGKPTPEACADLGFRAQGDYGDVGALTITGSRQSQSNFTQSAPVAVTSESGIAPAVTVRRRAVANMA